LLSRTLRGLRSFREQRVGLIFMDEAFWTNPRRVRPKKNEGLHYTAMESWNFASNYTSQTYSMRGPGQLSRHSDSLRTGRSGDRTRWGARFSAPVQTTPGVHPDSYIIGTGSFPGVKRPRRGVDDPPPSSAEVRERVELYFYSLYGPSWPVLGWPLPLPFLPPSCSGWC
jgi:hypothetical protein